jgi:hypothetical protein
MKNRKNKNLIQKKKGKKSNAEKKSSMKNLSRKRQKEGLKARVEAEVKNHLNNSHLKVLIKKIVTKIEKFNMKRIAIVVVRDIEILLKFVILLLLIFLFQVRCVLDIYRK